MSAPSTTLGGRPVSTNWDLGDRTQPHEGEDFAGPTPAGLLMALVKPRKRADAVAPPELVARAVAIPLDLSSDQIANVVKLGYANAPAVLVTPRRATPGGLVQMQPQYTPAQIARFWSKVDRNGPIPDYAPHLGPCWLWCGTIDRGYGRFEGNVSGQRVRYRAHVLAYLLLKAPFTAGHVLDHLCRVPRCVRPDHLEPVTQRENTLRGFGVPALNARKTHCVHGHNNWVGTRRGERACWTCIRVLERRRLPPPIHPACHDCNRPAIGGRHAACHLLAILLAAPHATLSKIDALKAIRPNEEAASRNGKRSQIHSLDSYIQTLRQRGHHITVVNGLLLLDPWGRVNE
jgi:hypothetical protein